MPPTPGMSLALLDIEPPLRVDDNHGVDEIQRRLTDRVPVRGRVVESTHLDLLDERVGKVVAAQVFREGREAAEAYVQDDAAGPDVYGEAVALSFGNCEDLGGDVWKKKKKEKVRSQSACFFEREYDPEEASSKSGVLQLGVPHKVVVSSTPAGVPIFLARPKSPILIKRGFSSTTRIFSGFISRCTHPWSCFLGKVSVT